MDKITLPPNGLPQELTNIPFGQVFVLTDPGQGITSTNATQIQAVISIAGKLGQSHIVYAIPVQYPELLDCFICKVETEKGVEILLSKKSSILEMLCEFWGLDFSDVCKTLDISKRYKGYVSKGGDCHPARVFLKPIEGKKAEKKDYGVTLQVLQDHTKPNTLSDIRKALQDNFYHNLGVSIEDIIGLYDEVKKSIKSYHLIIDIKKDEATGKISNCRFILEDNFGNQYPLMKPLGKEKDKPLEEWEVQWKALYLTFILFKEGLSVKEIAFNKEFYETFLIILGQLPRGFSKPNQMTLWENASSKISKIRSSIMEATNDTYALEQFGIDGYSKEVYKVSGATEENRETIKKEFGLE